jgi:hypothetical protein
MQAQTTDIIIYRVNEKGLEVFLFVDYPNALTSGVVPVYRGSIALEPYISESGETKQAIAVEADWHDIPSLRQLVYTDYVVAKQKAKHHIKAILPELPVFDFEKGTYLTVKEALKQALPAQYAFLKELKEIIKEKNQAKYV